MVLPGVVEVAGDNPEDEVDNVGDPTVRLRRGWNSRARKDRYVSVI